MTSAYNRDNYETTVDIKHDFPGGKDMDIKKMIRGHKLWLESRGKKGEKAVFTGMELSDVDFSNTDLREAEFHNCFMIRVDFSEANMEKCIIKHCFMPNCKFIGTVLRSSQITMTALNNSVFDKVDMSFSNIGLSEFDAVTFRYVHMISVKAHGATFNSAVFDKVDMITAVMFGVNMTNAKVNAKISGARFTGAFLYDADLSGATGNASFYKARGYSSARS